jgi:hypothetical protein
MTMEWNNKTYRFNPNYGNSNGSFQEHDRQIREFRVSHTDVALVNGPRLDEATFLESLLFLRVNYIMETGGSALPNDTTDRSALIPIVRVARYKFSQN